MSKKITYTFGDAELLDRIQPMWEGLNCHHAAVSPHFESDFQTYQFAERKTKLLKKYAAGQMRIDIAQFEDELIGYIISAITHEGEGEIESIYVTENFRGLKIGAEFMCRAIAWLDDNDIDTKTIAVAGGNERVYPFYARFGFYPRVTMLKQINNERRITYEST
jgi:diamine N-acetyltransferase